VSSQCETHSNRVTRFYSFLQQLFEEIDKQNVTDFVSDIHFTIDYNIVVLVLYFSALSLFIMLFSH